MAKRRADNILIPSALSKRCRRLCSVDIRLESMAPSAGLSPPSLLALLGNRCRKRHFYFDGTNETDHDLALAVCEGGLLKHNIHNNVMQQHTSGILQAGQSTPVAKSSTKRPREDTEEPVDTTYPKTITKVDPESPDSYEDNSYNSFQFWRTPLPELDMSLLENPLQKDSDAMEM